VRPTGNEKRFLNNEKEALRSEKIGRYWRACGVSLMVDR